MISELKEKLLNLSDVITGLISDAKNISDIEEIRVKAANRIRTIDFQIKNLM